MRTRKEKKQSVEQVEYGIIEVPEEITQRKNQKVRITMYVDGDILDAFKTWAIDTGTGYQTLMNEALRETAFTSPDQRKMLVTILKKLGERLTRIDQDRRAEAEYEECLDRLDLEPWRHIPAHTTHKRAR